MDECILNLFKMLLKSKGKFTRYVYTYFLQFIDSKVVDVGHLKAYLQFQNLHNSNPTLFKRVNDLCITTNFRGELNQNEFY